MAVSGGEVGVEHELEGLRAYSAELSSGFAQLRQNLGELRRELAELAVTAKSPDGLVSATVGCQGQLVELRLDPRIYRRQDSRHLSTVITQTVQDAGAEAARRVRELSDRYAGGMDLPSAVRGDLLARFERFGFVEEQLGRKGDR